MANSTNYVASIPFRLPASSFRHFNNDPFIITLLQISQSLHFSKTFISQSVNLFWSCTKGVLPTFFPTCPIKRTTKQDRHKGFWFNVIDRNKAFTATFFLLSWFLVGRHPAEAIQKFFLTLEAPSNFKAFSKNQSYHSCDWLPCQPGLNCKHCSLSIVLIFSLRRYQESHYALHKGIERMRLICLSSNMSVMRSISHRLWPVTMNK